MTSSKSPLKILVKKVTWLTAPLIVATSLAVHVKTTEPVSLESIPIKDTKVMTRALHFIEKNYVDPQSINPLRMLKLASGDLERSIAPLIVREREKGLEVSMGEKKGSIPVSNPVTLDDLPTVLSRLLGFLDLFYEGRLDERERFHLAMSGLVEALDPHSNYLPPKVYNEFKIGTKGNFGGLGIVIGIRDGDLTVIAPLEGTPAFEAGVKAKDKIVQIEEESTINMGLTEAVERLRGPVGSRVTVVINRAGIAAPLTFNLTRALIRIQSVGGRTLEKFALLKLKNFQEDTVDQFKKTLRNFRAGGVKPAGLILDLRNNPGGLLDQAIAVADYFLKKGTIVKTVGAHEETLELEEARPGDEGENLPVVVLVNEGSASASEIVAGALQFNDRAVVIGNRTFGKGSVQTVYDLKDGSALKLTIAKYLTAKDRQVQSIGINPDIGLIPATITEDDKGVKRVDLFEDVKKRELDLQEEEDAETEHKPADLPSSPFQMSYLESGKKEEEEATGRMELKDDFPVHLAERILELPNGAASDRQTALQEIPALLRELGEVEKGKIRDSINQLGVDWSEGEKKGKPAGSVTIEVLDEKDNPRQGLSAGESGFLRVTVVNRSNQPFYQLAAVTKSEDPLFANLEFPFGKVEPQGKKEWKTPLKMPDFIHRRSIPVDLEFREQHGRFPKSAPFFMQIEEPATPFFTYSYSVLDNGSQGTSGNGNRRAEKGETIGLQLKIKNIGLGESRASTVNLKNLEGDHAFIEKGRVELPTLPPEGETQALLRFRIPGKTEASKISFDLLILDSHLGEDLSDRLTISLNNEPPSPPPETVQSPPRIDLSPQLPSLVTDGASYRLKGVAKDDEDLKHLFLFVGDEKVFYQAPPEGEKSLSFETTLSLKKGANLITVAAQDGRELATRKQWIVWRQK